MRLRSAFRNDIATRDIGLHREKSCLFATWTSKYSKSLKMDTVWWFIMALNGGQRLLLELIGELSGHSVVTSVLDSVVIRRSGLPAEEVNMCLDQLEVLGLIVVGL